MQRLEQLLLGSRFNSGSGSFIVDELIKWEKTLVSSFFQGNPETAEPRGRMGSVAHKKQ